MNPKLKKIISIIFPFSLILTILSLVFMNITLTTNWIIWNRGSDQETNFIFDQDSNDKVKNSDKLFKVRDLNQLLDSYQSTDDAKILNLTKLNNHYELIAILGEITKLKAKTPIHQWWKTSDWVNFNNQTSSGYFNLAIKKTSFKLSFNNQIINQTIDYDVLEELTKIINGFEKYSIIQTKAFDVEAKGLNPVNQLPFDLAAIGDIGKYLLEIPIVQSLMKYSQTLGLNLSKLTNLPKESFINFAELIKKLDLFTNQIFNSTVTQTWISHNKVNLNLESSGKSFNKTEPITAKELFQAKFLYELINKNSDSQIEDLVDEDQQEIIDNDVNDNKNIDDNKDLDNNENNEEARSALTIDLNQINSVEALLDQFNAITNVFMPVKASELVKTQNNNPHEPWITQESFKSLKQYTDNINFKTNQIKFKFQDNYHVADLTKIEHTIKQVKSKIDKGHQAFLTEKQARKFVPAFTLSIKVPNMPFTIGYMTGYGASEKMSGFGSIPDNGYLDYLEMMEAYHTFAYQLSTSNVFNNWININNKTYDLFETFWGNTKPINVKPGNLFDANKKPSDTILKATKPLELNNFEAQLVLTLCNAYGTNHGRVPKPIPDIKTKEALIDLNNIKSVNHLLQTFNQLTNTFMPMAMNDLVKLEASLTGPAISKQSFNNLKTYTDKINFLATDIKFKYQNQEISISLTEIQKHVNIIKQKINLGYNAFHSTAKTLSNLSKYTWTVSNMPSLLNWMLGSNFAIKTLGFGAVPEEGINNYMDMMDAYNDFAYTLSTSSVYQQWINSLTKDNQYYLVVWRKSSSWLGGWNKTIEHVAYGQEYDNDTGRNKLPSGISFAQPKERNKITNLAAQLILALTNSNQNLSTYYHNGYFNKPNFNHDQIVSWLF